MMVTALHRHVCAGRLATRAQQAETELSALLAAADEPTEELRRRSQQLRSVLEAYMGVQTYLIHPNETSIEQSHQVIIIKLPDQAIVSTKKEGAPLHYVCNYYAHPNIVSL
jgi:hypothetical protein